ncbi:hypothetical protein BG011_003447 [Mortierella polycephala]|uniref:Uncharacterized protein n=1 Tax=Mortierella polycephala TaxID=41804 RepID=A0A9P6Q0V2_9FUNG|nr:hypothetical protein BG011_003447 [Mortierella polycephala]
MATNSNDDNRNSAGSVNNGSYISIQEEDSLDVPLTPQTSGPFVSDCHVDNTESYSNGHNYTCSSGDIRNDNNSNDNDNTNNNDSRSVTDHRGNIGRRNSIYKSMVSFVRRPSGQPSEEDPETMTTAPDGLSRFRKAAQHAVAAQRLSAYVTRGQGVDPSDMDSVFGCIETTVDVTVMDMNESRHTKRQGLDNDKFLQWLTQPRPKWSKVRWININGMSWDVIKAISIKYELHHLAVEDLLHVPQRTKVDMYSNQTYIACTLLTLMETLEDGTVRQVDPTSSPLGIEPELLNQRLPLDKLDHYNQQYPVKGTEGGLTVQMEQVTMFLLQEGTLITIFQVSGASVVNQIAERMTHTYSIARRNNDATFLLQSVVDGIVDQMIPITDAYRQRINDLELHVLALPRMKFTKDLHMMTAQLAMLKRTLAPTQTLVHALMGKDERSPLTNISRTYMGDVMDHCNTMVEDIESMLGLCEKLINMIFNIIAYDTNESMKRLAIVSIIFLPITFIAGVYGTNFTNFPELNNSISYFWIICGVVTAVVLAAFFLEWLTQQRHAQKVERRLKRHEPTTIGAALPQKTKNYIQLGGFVAVMTGVFFRGRIMEVVDPSRRQAREARGATTVSGKSW